MGCSRPSPPIPAAASLLAAALAAGCVGDMPRPSLVEGLRVLGLRATPPAARSGETVELELLWADPEPYCSEAQPCPAGRSCVDGRCRRDEPTEIAWVALSLSTIEAAGDVDLSQDDDGTCALEGCPPPIPCEGDDGCPPPFSRCVDGFCLPCLAFGPATFCCGDASLVGRIEVEVPEVGPGVGCDDPNAIDLSQLLQVQAQVCAGGRVDLCVEPGTTTFGCEGEGADTVVAQSRVPVDRTLDWPNASPEIAAVELNGLSWDADGAAELPGCLDEDCSNRDCDDDDGCADGRSCSDGTCRDELKIVLGPEAAQTYLDDCDEPSSCGSDDDCEPGWACVDGACLRIESPLVSFYATTGSVDAGRALLDEDADGRPDGSDATTLWIPPVLDECSSPSDPCTFGRCDPERGRCVGEVSFWAVVRDGRGGQSWESRTALVVP